MERDTSRDGWQNRLRYGLLTSGKPVWDKLNRMPVLHGLVNRALINNAIKLSLTRPHPFSTLATYSSLDSLRDRSYFTRHLPESDRVITATDERVAALFERPREGARLSTKSTLLFASFAQWFTDGFLLTDLQPEGADTTHRTHSSHDLDLSQLYGLTPRVTRQLRLLDRGRLKSVRDDGEEFPPRLYDAAGVRVAEFSEVPEPALSERIEDAAQKHSWFAFGGERTNSTPQTAMLNTLMLREHNRLCGLLEREYPQWDDERLFQTARNILVVILIRIVISEYINHITPYHHQFELDPRVVWRAKWNRPAWFAVEFNMLYRWHSLIPDFIRWGGRRYTLGEWLLDNRPLLSSGLAVGFDASSRQAAGEIGLLNTPTALMHTERRAIAQGRRNKLATYNDYREAMNYPRVTSYEQISSSPRLIARLREVYPRVEDLEFYVGLFAEDARENAAVPSLLGRMVALDAFSQALVCPLLSEHVYNDATFSKLGLEQIAQTECLGDLVARNVSNDDRLLVSMTQRPDAPIPREWNVEPSAAPN